MFVFAFAFAFAFAFDLDVIQAACGAVADVF